MFFHHKDLAFTVRVDEPNPVFARMLQQAIGGPEGEMRVALQYLFQGWGYRGPDKYRDMILSTATEEIGHIELLATAVTMNLEGAPGEQLDALATNPAVAARLGAADPRHFLTGGMAALPTDANGAPFDAACIDAGGNLIANLRANVAAEAIGRTLACRLLEMTDDPGMKDLLRYLIARDTMHQQQWLAVLEELGPEMATNAPGDFENTDRFAEHAYQFIDHQLDAEIDRDARFASGPSLDGKGTFSVVKPDVASAPQVPLEKAPPQGHAGVEATKQAGGGRGRGARTAKPTRAARTAASAAGTTRRTARPAARDLGSMTKDELLKAARDAGIEGRSGMSKTQLVAALKRR